VHESIVENWAVESVKKQSALREMNNFLIDSARVKREESVDNNRRLKIFNYYKWDIIKQKRV
jgi:hypothetical protein